MGPQNPILIIKAPILGFRVSGPQGRFGFWASRWNCSGIRAFVEVSVCGLKSGCPESHGGKGDIND